MIDLNVWVKIEENKLNMNIFWSYFKKWEEGVMTKIILWFWYKFEKFAYIKNGN